VDPPAFVAVTVDRIVWPTSPATNVYVVAVAPVIAVQFAPALSQSCHLYAYEVGLPVHVPLLVVNLLPCCAVPPTAGSAVLDGGDGGPATTPVWAEVAGVEPPAFDAVTTDRIV
jgi:hypothetical protein